MKIKYGLVVLLCFFIFIIPLFSIFIDDNQTNKIQNTQSSQNNQQNNDKIKNQENQEFKILDVSTKNVLSLKEKDYLLSAVLSEITDDTHDEAIKTQAVVTYTYASKMRADEQKNKTEELNGAYFKVDVSKNIGYISEEAAKNKFKSKYKSINNKVKKIIDQIYGISILYNGDYIISSYHAISAGKTESSETVYKTQVPYLIPVDSEFDKQAKNYRAEIILKKDDIINKFKQKFPDIEFNEGDESLIKIENKSESQSVVSAKVGNKIISGKEIREILSLKSIAFDIENNNNEYKFITYGIGNGVGLSQYGANEMAKQGKTYTEILNHYYPSTELKRI